MSLAQKYLSKKWRRGRGEDFIAYLSISLRHSTEKITKNLLTLSLGKVSMVNF